MTADLERLKAEYAAREQRLAGSRLYHVFNPSALFAVQERQRASVGLLTEAGIQGLQDLRILEVGCGSGGVLAEHLMLGATATRAHGIDLLRSRLDLAHHALAGVPLVQADGQHIPFASNSFDLVLQYTAFSSILDLEVRRNVANEMLRVLNKPSGLIIWYDFWWNPKNRQTRGLRPAEVLSLFPGCAARFLRITLAPPLARRLAPISWSLAHLLERLRIFNTHYLAAIRVSSEAKA